VRHRQPHALPLLRKQPALAAHLVHPAEQHRRQEQQRVRRVEWLSALAAGMASKRRRSGLTNPSQGNSSSDEG
jgi:hypothetical protein